MRHLICVLTVALAVVVGAVASVSPGAALTPTAGLPAPGAPFTVVQMNLCLSGYAPCYGRTAYPAVLDEVADQVDGEDADAVTLNETCSADTRALARRTGLHVRFSAVLVGGAPLPCVAPEGRGVFGLAVLTRDAVRSSQDRAFAVHDGQEERRWLCVTTVEDVTVCTAHLAAGASTAEHRANGAECAELRGVLRRYDAGGATVFGGDLNRRGSCAPRTMWDVRDAGAEQQPGLQHVSGTRSLTQPRLRVSAATRTDHDFLTAVGTLVTA